MAQLIGHEEVQCLSDLQENATQAKLLAIWRDVLENPDCTLETSFLDAGGDSMTAMICISRIQKEFGRNLSLEDFFMDDSTVIKIAPTVGGTPE